jgi:sugar phosphate isomerase/epimerase
VLLAEQVGPACGVCLDCFHMNIEEQDMFAAIKATGSRLNDFHVADNNRMACGMGALDWKRIIDTLKSAGYDGALTVEFVAPLDRTPANPYTNMLAAETADMTPEERKFMIDHGTGDLSNEFYTWLVDETIKTLRKNM